MALPALYRDKDGILRWLLDGTVATVKNNTPVESQSAMEGRFYGPDEKLHDIGEILGGGGGSSGPETDPIFSAWRPTADTKITDLGTYLNGHILEDSDVRWPSVTKSISDLRSEMKQFVIDTYAGTVPKYDYSQKVVILAAGGLVNLADQGVYTIQTNGAIQAQVGGLLGVGLQVQVNGETVWTAPLNLLLPLNSPEIQVNAGDQISYIGTVGVGQTIEVDFFPNRGTETT